MSKNRLFAIVCAALLAVVGCKPSRLGAVVDNAAGMTITSTGLHANGKVIDGLPTPAATNEAATKAYADTKVPSVFGRTGAITATTGDYTLNQLGAPTADFSMSGTFGFTSMRDGVTSTEAATYGEIANPFNVFTYWDDFTGAPLSTGSYAPLGFVFAIANSGTVTNVSTGQDSTHLGVWQLSTAAVSAAGRACIIPPSAAAFWTPGTAGAMVADWLVKVPTLSTTGTQQFILEIGLGDTCGGTQANGVYFQYDAATDTHWRVCTAAASTRTCTNTTNTVTAGQWDRLGITKAEGSGHYGFFVNKVDTGITSSTNEPTLVSYPLATIVSSVGTSAKTALVDIFRMKIHFATERGP